MGTIKNPILQQTALACLSVLFVLVTGGTHSPLLFVLYFPILLAAQRGWGRLALAIGLVDAILFLMAYDRVLGSEHQPLDRTMAGIALSFPAVATFAGLLHKPILAQHRRLNNRTNELSTLLDMSQMMDAAFDLDMTLNLLLLNVQKLSNCQVCAVYLKDGTGEKLELKAASGARERVELTTSIAIHDARYGDWAVEDVFHAGSANRACYVPETATVSLGSISALQSLDRRVRSFACVPLTSIEGFIGMLYVGYDLPNALNADGVERLENLAERAAFPLQRVLLQQGFQSMAYIDSKTGLDNYRQFEQHLNTEVSRADRYGHRLSVIVIDIDHFKLFNDTYGHPAGDGLLAQLAIVLRNSLREVDKPARYGGEEFAIICPETGKEEARLISERIRRNVMDAMFALLEKNSDSGPISHARVTVSVGFATFPQDARAPQELLKKADAALYAAKGAGRNTVRGHEDVSTRVMLGG